MIVSKPELISQGGYLQYQVHVHFSGKPKTLWYSIREEFADLVSDRSDAPLLALLIPAMSLGEDIHIEGIISEKLFYNLSGPYQKVLKVIIPSLHIINIIPSDVRPAPNIGKGVAMGFSAGIDSFCVLADHHYSEVSKGFKVTHLLFNNVGSHGPDEKKSRHLFHKRYNRLKPITEQIRLPFIAVDSNLDSFYSGLDFEQTHTPRNASVALLLQNGFKRFLYASSYHYSYARVKPEDTMAHSDTITLPLISTEALDMISSGSQYTRVEKTLKVAGIEESHRSLDVCTEESPHMINCSACFKCMRTMLTLEIAGKLERYANVFDLDTYKKNRDLYIEEVLQSKDPLLWEIANFIKTSGFHVPLSSRFYLRRRLFFITTSVKRSANIPMRIARKIKREYLKSL
jgi:hypothetical protein